MNEKLVGNTHAKRQLANTTLNIKILYMLIGNLCE